VRCSRHSAQIGPADDRLTVGDTHGKTFTIRVFGPPDILRLLAVLPESPSAARRIAAEAGGYERLFADARVHGVLPVVFHALKEDAPAATARDVEKVLAVQALENELILHALVKALEALRRANIRCAALKGPILAERLYGSPLARSSTDIDLLVDEAVLDHARAALSTIGYARAPSGPYAEAGHHHLILFHPAFPILELHFHAYSGFGTRIGGRELLGRVVVFESASAGNVPVLSPADELVALAIHGAGHRFTRLAWLYDLKLLVERLTLAELACAAERAQAWECARVLAFTGQLLSDVLGVPRDVVRPLGSLGLGRRAILKRIAAEPPGYVARYATKFVFMNLLCDSVGACARYSAGASADYLKRVARLSEPRPLGTPGP
jgi:hypothetical protein